MSEENQKAQPTDEQIFLLRTFLAVELHAFFGKPARDVMDADVIAFAIRREKAFRPNGIATQLRAVLNVEPSDEHGLPIDSFGLPIEDMRGTVEQTMPESEQRRENIINAVSTRVLEAVRREIQTVAKVDREKAKAMELVFDIINRTDLWA